MNFIRSIHNLRPRHRGCVLTIGNFDGFHRGHQSLIADLQIEGQRRGLPVMVMIFEPQPQEYFAKNTSQVRLTMLRDKIKYLTAAGVDTVLCATFNEHFSMLSAQTFITDLLVQKLDVQFIGIGDDFRFGAKRHGDFTLLMQAGRKAGFDVISSATCTEGGKRISSTAVREALAKNQLIDAEILLGHPYRISGRVVYGESLGRIIGFPTANISLKKCQVPINGVYAVEVYGISSVPLPGIANIGTRPTVAGFHQRLEVHLLNLNMNLYGYHIEVVIRAKIRNEQQFTSLNELRRQITKDIISVHNYFMINRISL